MALNKHTRNKVLIVLSYIFASALIITGIALVAVFYPNFEQYQKAIYYFNEETNGLGNFSDFLSNYNNNATSYSWPIASINEFAPGITLLVVGLIIMVITIIVNLKAKKNWPKKVKIKKIKK